MSKKDMPFTTTDRDSLLREISDGASRVFENASDLLREALLLRNHGALSRALFLHQISLEECAKIDILGEFAVSVLMGHEVDRTKLSAALAEHKAKNYSNAYMLSASDEEKKARADRDWTRAIEAFKKQQTMFHHESNWAKNAALYVDYENGQFGSPNNKITERMVTNIAILNSKLLNDAGPKVRMLSRWLTDLDEVQRMTQWFISRLKELDSHGSGPEEIMSTYYTRDAGAGEIQLVLLGCRWWQAGRPSLIFSGPWFLPAVFGSPAGAARVQRAEHEKDITMVLRIC